MAVVGDAVTVVVGDGVVGLCCRLRQFWVAVSVLKQHQQRRQQHT